MICDYPERTLEQIESERHARERRIAELGIVEEKHIGIRNSRCVRLRSHNLIFPNYHSVAEWLRKTTGRNVMDRAVYQAIYTHTKYHGFLFEWAK